MAPATDEPPPDEPPAALGGEAGDKEAARLAKATRRARWAHEDARRAEAEHLGDTESVGERSERVLNRHAELSRESPDQPRSAEPESEVDQRMREDDEAEITRELGG
jgi:hypothetical protein